MRKVLLIAALALMVMATGCSKDGLKTDVVYEMGQEHVYLMHETNKEGKTVSQVFDHPANYPPEQIDKLLAAITYSEYSFFKWRGNKQVFIEEERAKLSKHLSQAFAAAGPNHWVKFAVTAKKRDLLLPTRRLTDGYAFILHDKLNIVLSNLNYEISDADDPYSGDPRSRFAMGALRFNEADGINQPPVDSSDKLLKRPHNNWVMIDPKVILGAPAETTKEATSVKEMLEQHEQPAGQPEVKVEEKSLEQRMMELKDLLDKGLITQEDYDRKKAELLEEL